MNMAIFVRVVRDALCAASVCLGALHCSRPSEAKTQEVSEPVSATPAVASVDNANYTAKIEQSGACKIGETCILQVSVVAKGEYHINDKYPYKFKSHDPPREGVRYPKPVVGKEDAKLEEKKALLQVPFIADQGGKRSVGGTLSLSVCSAANCLMDKQALELLTKVD